LQPVRPRTPGGSRAEACACACVGPPTTTTSYGGVRPLAKRIRRRNPKSRRHDRLVRWPSREGALAVEGRAILTLFARAYKFDNDKLATQGLLRVLTAIELAAIANSSRNRSPAAPASGSTSARRTGIRRKKICSVKQRSVGGTRADTTNPTCPSDSGGPAVEAGTHGDPDHPDGQPTLAIESLPLIVSAGKRMREDAHTVPPRGIEALASRLS